MSLFEKPALTTDQHLKMMRERGLIILDEGRCKRYLSNISYFRFSAYISPFYKPAQTDHTLLENTSFEDILNLYVFDRELRLLLLDVIERLEVSLRAQVANTLAEHYDPHGYLNNVDIFNTNYDRSWLVNKLRIQPNSKTAEQFIIHYRNKYTSAPLEPPIWMVVELLTFKEVSTLFSNLRQAKDTQRIEAHFGWKYPILKSWFRSLSDLRNLCAHHGRVWNREFGSRPEMPKRIPTGWANVPDAIPTGSKTNPYQTINPRRRLYFQLVVIESLMRVVCLESRWTERLADLLERNPQVSKTHMGFPVGWDQEDFWMRKG